MGMGLTKKSSGQLSKRSRTGLWATSKLVVTSPKKRPQLTLLPGLMRTVLPSHKKHGTSLRLVSMKLMPTAMEPSLLMSLLLLSSMQLRRKVPQLTDHQEEKEDQEEVLFSR